MNTSIQYIEALHQIKSFITSSENKVDIESGTALTAFEATSIIAILFGKTKEEVMIDYLNCFKNNPYEH